MEEELKLIQRYQKEIKLLTHTHALLHWDMEAYMPKEGISSRAEKFALLSGLIHEKMTSEELFFALETLKSANLQEEKDRILVERLHKHVERARKLPKEFVEELSKQEAIAGEKWKEAKEKSDFKIFQPELEKIIELKRKEASYIGLKGHLYNSLLDDYEEGITIEELAPKFESLKKELISLLKDIRSSDIYKNQKVILKNKPFPKEKQLELSYDVAKRIGLEKEFSRIDFSSHPFTIKIGNKDVRITTAIKEDPLYAFSATIHESGHALYELGMPYEESYLFLSDAPSMGIHESQSRFWENMVGLGESFWKFYFPKFNQAFNLEDNFEQWYKEVNMITPCMTRVESDEIHYCLHIILRTELEVRLIDGSISVSDLPKLWNEKMKEYFGKSPKNDSEGVLQDIHWAHGCFGYFPTYALGTIYACQLYNQLASEYPNLESDIESGDYKKIRSWLKDNVHIHGRALSTEEIIKNICGSNLSPEVFLSYLKNKYSKLYNLEKK